MTWIAIAAGIGTYVTFALLDFWLKRWRAKRRRSHWARFD